ncbi:Gfo/Idh/MocA family protein [Spirosoma endophyticum]|uniref:Oxidoreductase family, C-terminal alpha/beta domain n=1 Tax=Spirosoma endophyticum TaxID=662367 RepID=A0A1I1PDK5_9BACT|nr:Gfo/Idh/MocA family oxidoreductase [Spirosoma endophyticum]SFD04040.1 Oxidoreductase family, C-terminal alpha/beta domain [Spirosoma endophyticum]
MDTTPSSMETNELENREIGIGVIGMGGFGLFAVQQFLQTPHTKLIAIAGSKRQEAITTAKRFGAEQLGTLDELVNHPQVDLVYIATPPFMHYEQAMLALNAGKHVICEKPLAMNPKQGAEMLALAKEKGLLMVTNLMQRYNPMFARIKHLIDKKLLGDFLHGYFENYAGDEGLLPEHWFWDRSKSGGIFIEHGVHFFDMFAGWLGEGTVKAAQVIKRPNSADIEDQVQAIVEYGDDETGRKLVNFYHGFTQTGRMDRQEMRLLFEQGDITLFEWVPTRMIMRCVVDEETTRALMNLFPGAQLNVTANVSGEDRPLRGRHKEFDAYQQIEIRFGFGDEKQHLYSELLRLMFRDQVNAIHYPDVHRIINESNGLNSLETAMVADQMARQSL